MHFPTKKIGVNLFPRKKCQTDPHSHGKFCLHKNVEKKRQIFWERIGRDIFLYTKKPSQGKSDHVTAIYRSGLQTEPEEVTS